MFTKEQAKAAIEEAEYNFTGNHVEYVIDEIRALSEGAHTSYLRITIWLLRPLSGLKTVNVSFSPTGRAHILKRKRR